MRLVIRQTGEPLEVLELEAWEAPEPRDHEVRVKMSFAPINPADLNFIEGTYGRGPELPTTPGIEGCGHVEAVGPAVESLAVGDLVLPIHPAGTWSSHVVMGENQFARLPQGFDEVQAAMLRVNPTTAWRMLHAYRELKKGEWVAQNAANSGVGRAVIQEAKKLGLRTVNFVRRAEVMAELVALGADAVFLDTAEGLEEAKALLAKIPVRLALNAVGGDSALRLMELLAASGTHVTYGAMSRRSLKVPNKFLIFKDLEIRGCWLSLWLDHAGHSEIEETMRPLVEMVMKGELVMPVERIFPVTEFRDAVALAQESGRAGKVLLAF